MSKLIVSPCNFWRRSGNSSPSLRPRLAGPEQEICLHIKMGSHWPLLVRTGQQCENMRQRPTANPGSQYFKGEEQETGGTLSEFSKPHLRPALQFRLCVQFTSVVNQSEVYPFDQFWYEEWLDGKSRVVLWGKRMLIWSCHLPGHLLSLLSDCLPITPSLSLHTSPPHQSHHHHQDLLKTIWREERAEGLLCTYTDCLPLPDLSVR